MGILNTRVILLRRVDVQENKRGVNVACAEMLLCRTTVYREHIDVLMSDKELLFPHLSSLLLITQHHQRNYLLFIITVYINILDFVKLDFTREKAKTRNSHEPHFNNI